MDGSKTALPPDTHRSVGGSESYVFRTPHIHHSNHYIPLPDPLVDSCVWKLDPQLVALLGRCGGKCPWWRKCVTEGGFWGLRCSSQAQYLTLFLLSIDPHGDAALYLSLCSLMCCHASCHDDSGLKLWTVSQPQINIFLFKSWRDHGVSSQQ